ncbi:uncharacterized protein I206_105253 [Kwoniella pini CBS 10737]|uniref:Uncharacterized protein n=1 Tax=Kwoniella pini CBS 10737 TaxID=1296096 RepID=A0A1B9I4S7_9TREE|nr:uncharacterized protein I206_03838 [Kwoniella pini CBS 10737]OCF50514.1 hypothetical protein I206_03838 [Kwoniella pini CBS 10737]
MTSVFKIASRLHPSIQSALSSIASSTSGGSMKRYLNPITNRQNIIVTTNCPSSSFIRLIKPNSSFDNSKNKLNERLSKVIPGNRTINLISYNDNMLFQINNLPIQVDNGTIYHCKPFSYLKCKTSSIEGENNLNKCLGLNLFCPSFGESNNQVEIRALYDLPISNYNNNNNNNNNGDEDSIEFGNWFTPKDFNISDDSEIYNDKIIPLSDLLERLEQHSNESQQSLE